MKHGGFDNEILNVAATAVDPDDDLGPFERKDPKWFGKPAVVAGQDADASEVEVEHGPPGPVICSLAEDEDVDLIVAIGSGFPGVKEWIQFWGDPADVPVAT